MRNAQLSALLAMVTAALQPACGDSTAAGGGGATSNGGNGGESSGGGGSMLAIMGGGSTADDMGGGPATGGGGQGGNGGNGGNGGDGGSGGVPTVRRPFLVGASLRSAGAEDRDDWATDLAGDDTEVDSTTRAMLAKVWLQDAREEHASIAAFARWTMLMLSAGAPPELVRESQRASLDEIEHAKACFGLAARYAGRACGPADLDLTDAMAPMTLVEIAALAAEEGCVGETLGVALAKEQLARCTDAGTKRVLARLVRDEERHARIAWDFIAWAIRRGGDPVRDAVVAAIGRAARATLEAPIVAYDGVDLDAWHAHGRVTCEEAREVAREAIGHVLEPALAMLSPRTAA